MTDAAPINEVLTAIAKAMGNVKRIAKEGMNTHDKYKFASIDDFLAALNPLCAEAGLVFHMQEAEREDFIRAGKYGETHWIRVRFDITVYHVSGQSLPPVSRSVEVIRSGAQAYGSAQSYCLKQFMRGLLLVPTGDGEDADNQAKAPEGEAIRPQHSMRAPRQEMAPNPEADQLAQERAAKIAGWCVDKINAIHTLKSLDELKAFWAALAKDIPEVARDPDVIKAKDERKAELTAAQKEAAE
jgi:hypothetical protein